MVAGDGENDVPLFEVCICRRDMDAWDACVFHVKEGAKMMCLSLRCVFFSSGYKYMCVCM
jgi:hypothetical protein